MRNESDHILPDKKRVANRAIFGIILVSARDECRSGDTGVMLKTEIASQRYKGLDTWDDDEILRALWDGQMNAVAALRPAMPALAAAAGALADRLNRPTSRLVYAGAGASGLLAIQDGMEMTPTFGWPSDRLIFLMAGGDKARLSPDGASEDDADSAEWDVGNHGLGPDDAVIAVAASGTTRYTCHVVAAAKKAGTLTVAIANNADTELLNQADCPVLLDTGPEVIAGSTRLGAGTAQKAALGILSTLVMVWLGHVMDGLMVSMVATNAKLQDRAARMLQSITGAGDAEAREALQAAQGRVKTAALIVRGLDAGEADRRLAAAGGNLRRALAGLDPDGST